MFVSCYLQITVFVLGHILIKLSLLVCDSSFVRQFWFLKELLKLFSVYSFKWQLTFMPKINHKKK